MKITTLKSNNLDKSVELILSNTELAKLASALKASTSVNAEYEHIATVFDAINQLVQNGMLETWNEEPDKFKDF